MSQMGTFYMVIGEELYKWSKLSGRWRYIGQASNYPDILDSCYRWPCL